MASLSAKNQTSKPVALVIDDEVQLRRLLRISLEANGYKVIDAATGQSGLAEVANCRPDVIILDLGLPDIDGMEVMARLRKSSNVPIVVLSVRDSEDDKILALTGGADDYVTKPFSTGELLARLGVARRHFHSKPVAHFHAGPLEVNLASRQVNVNGRPVKLTTTEYALLRLFIQNPGRILSHSQILNAVWGPDDADKTQYLHIYMNHLRQKIELDPHKPELLVTETRVGYRLNMKTPMATQINNPSVTPPVGDEGQTDKLEGLDPTLY